MASVAVAAPMTPADAAAHGRRLQRARLATRGAFFLLFLAAPMLDLLRLDLHAGHFVVLGMDWTLDVGGLADGSLTPAEAALRLLARVFLPAGLLLALLGWASWRYGRIYCGWLCPHFSVVESINGLWRRGWRRPGLWERRALPHHGADGRPLPGGPLWKAATLLAVIGCAWLWAVTLLTYLLPPAEVWGNLLAGEPTRNQALFIGVATLLFCGEFAFARHLFCRFGCALGVAQSFVWIANRRARVVGFDRTRARACASCFAACEHACPMRLKPRSIKRLNFSCTQCARCIEACEQVQQSRADAPSLLAWVRDEAALAQSERAPRRR